MDLLLWRWEAIKLDKKGAEETTWRKLLQEVKLNDIDLKQALWELAFTTHGQLGDSPGADSTVGIPEATLHRALRDLHPKRNPDWADKLVEIMKLRAGLLLEGEPDVYSFPHRTFEEYLSGCHINTLDFTAEAVELAGQGPFWWEVILLAVGRLRIEDEINSRYGEGFWSVFKARERTHTHCIRPFAQRGRRAKGQARSGIYFVLDPYPPQWRYR
ncbi:MAG: hypothetical protein GY859_03530 [Desulfobacterales bacterium]|nr:hypothetical protein [Desulfobacterales bacterium]